MIYSKFRIVLSVCIIALFSTSFNTQATAMSRVLILGDSLSASYGLKQEQGWVHLLQLAYNDKEIPVQLINASISGETTGGALRRLSAILTEHKPDYVLIELGGNDGLRGFPITTLQNNLIQLIEKTKDFGAIPALMKIEILPNYGPRYSAMFSQAFKTVSEQTNVKLMPFFMETIAINKEFMQADGIHPNLAAQPFIRNVMEQEINQLIQHK